MSSNSQRTATTTDGKKVRLKDDGTWEYEQPTENVNLPSQTPDFRKTFWGMTREQVKAAEGQQASKETNNNLVYESLLLNLHCWIVYIFAAGQLVRGKYMITQEHSNQNEYLSDFNLLKEMLRKKYGPPTSEDVHWLNDLYQDSYQDWGMAVSAGHLSFYTGWASAGTDITLYLTGDNYTINLGVEYVSATLSYLEDKEREQQALDML